MTRNRAIVIGPDEGRELSLGTMRLRFPADEPETSGRYAISVVDVPAEESGTTPHTHREHDDVTFLVKGTLGTIAPSHNGTSLSPLNPSVLGPGAACVQRKRRLGRPSFESLNTTREALAAGAGVPYIA